MDSVNHEPAYAAGKICYVEIPAVDAQRSGDFYSKVFGWALRRHSDGSLSFDDTVGQVSGMWVLDRKPMTEPGLIVSIMVADAVAVCAAIEQAGGSIVRSTDPDAPEITAWFRDPAGNVMGIYEQSGLSGG